MYRIIDDDAQILLVKPVNANHYWSLPRDTKLNDENLEECAKRILEEDLGMKINLELDSKLPAMQLVRTIDAWLATSDDNVKINRKKVRYAEWFSINDPPQVQRFQRHSIYTGIQMIKKKMGLEIDDKDGIDKRIVKEIEFLAKHANDYDKWLDVKKAIMKQLSADLKDFFSRRHPLTKKQVPNDFDRLVARRWTELTGKVLEGI